MQYLHTMVRVADLDKALDFYVAKLGLKEVRRIDNERGRFTLVFLAAPDDEARSTRKRAPEVELTHNWDPEDYQGGRNFGHLAYLVEDIYASCQRLADGGVTINRPPRDGHMAFAGRHLHRASAKGRAPAPRRALGLHAECRSLVAS
jgi:lactoylglutathione lyase